MPRSTKRWAVPSKRAKRYASERKSGQHHYGRKKGRKLTDFEAGLRSGYLQCQSDHAGIYKYKKQQKANKAAATRKAKKAK